jgi:hypothetical protein
MREVLFTYQYVIEADGVGSFADQLHNLVVSNADQLLERNLRGPVVRYGPDWDREEAIKRLGKLSADPKHFVIASSGSIIGAASFYRSLPLRRNHSPLPPLLGDIPGLGIDYPFASPEVKAWTSAAFVDELNLAYSGLMEIWREVEENKLKMLRNYRDLYASPPSDLQPSLSWTLEPDSTPAHVIDAITGAGLMQFGEGFYDDREISRNPLNPSAWQMTPKSKLFVPTDYFGMPINEAFLTKGYQGDISKLLDNVNSPFPQVPVFD